MKDKIGGDSFERKLPNDEEPQVAIMYGIVGLGTHKKTKYKSTELIDKREMLFLFELTEDFIEMKDGEEKPMTVNMRITRSMDDRSNLYRFVKNWIGAKYLEQNEYMDWKKFIGGVGQIELLNKVSQNDRKYTKVENFTRIPKGSPKPTRFNNKFFFDIEDDQPDWDSFLLMPKWVMKIVEESSEWRALLKSGKIPDHILEELEEEEENEKQERHKEKRKRPEKVTASVEEAEDEGDGADLFGGEDDEIPWDIENEGDDEESEYPTV
jgi:hypothetical protein